MTRKLKDLTGQVFGEMRVICRWWNSNKRGTRYLVECSCGSLTVKQRAVLMRNKTGLCKKCIFPVNAMNATKKRQETVLTSPLPEIECGYNIVGRKLCYIAECKVCKRQKFTTLTDLRKNLKGCMKCSREKKGRRVVDKSVEEFAILHKSTGRVGSTRFKSVLMAYEYAQRTFLKNFDIIRVGQ